jgi:hypothetical protein
MSVITFQCYACNQMLKVGADKGGKKTKCIKCGTILTIPVAAAEPEVLAPEVIDDRAPVKKPSKGPPPPRPARGRRKDEFKIDEDEDERPRKRSQREEEADEETRPRKKRRADEDDVDRPAKRRSRSDEDDEDDRPRRRRERAEDDEDDDDRPRKRRRDEEDEEDEDHPRRRRHEEEDDDYDRRRVKKTDWAKVRLGMLLCFIGLCAFGVGALLEQIGVTVAAVGTFNSRLEDGDVFRGFGGQKKKEPDQKKEAADQKGDETLPSPVLIKIAVCLMPVALLVLLAGQVFWMFTCNDRAAWIWAVAAVGVSALVVLFMVIFKTIAVFPAKPTLPYGIYALFAFEDRVGPFVPPIPSIGRALLSSLVNILVAVQFIMMALYIRAQALNKKDQSLAGGAMFLVILASIVAGYQFLWPIMVNLLFSFPTPTKGPLALTWIVYWIGALLTLLLIGVMILATKRAHNMSRR